MALATAKNPLKKSQNSRLHRLVGKDVEFLMIIRQVVLGCGPNWLLVQKQSKEQFQTSVKNLILHLFHLQNPQEMVVKFPIKGNPKNLETGIFQDPSRSKEG